MPLIMRQWAALPTARCLALCLVVLSGVGEGKTQNLPRQHTLAADAYRFSGAVPAPLLQTRVRGSGKGAQDKILPPENIETIGHKKVKGNGYAVGSPLYQRQKELADGAALAKAAAQVQAAHDPGQPGVEATSFVLLLSVVCISVAALVNTAPPPSKDLDYRASMPATDASLPPASTANVNSFRPPSPPSSRIGSPAQSLATGTVPQTPHGPPSQSPYTLPQSQLPGMPPFVPPTSGYVAPYVPPISINQEKPQPSPFDPPEKPSPYTLPQNHSPHAQPVHSSDVTPPHSTQYAGQYSGQYDFGIGTHPGSSRDGAPPPPAPISSLGAAGVSRPYTPPGSSHSPMNADFSQVHVSSPTHSQASQPIFSPTTSLNLGSNYQVPMHSQSMPPPQHGHGPLDSSSPHGYGPPGGSWQSLPPGTMPSQPMPTSPTQPYVGGM